MHHVHARAYQRRSTAGATDTSQDDDAVSQLLGVPGHRMGDAHFHHHPVDARVASRARAPRASISVPPSESHDKQSKEEAPITAEEMAAALNPQHGYRKRGAANVFDEKKYIATTVKRLEQGAVACNKNWDTVTGKKHRVIPRATDKTVIRPHNLVRGKQAVQTEFGWKLPTPQLREIFARTRKLMEEIWTEMRVPQIERDKFAAECYWPETTENYHKVHLEIQRLSDLRASQSELLRLVEEREGHIERMRQLADAFRPEDASVQQDALQNELVNLVQDLRHTTCELTHAILLWRSKLNRPQPFTWNGSNYLLKMQNDLLFLKGSQLERCLTCSVEHNPFLLPHRQENGAFGGNRSATPSPTKEAGNSVRSKRLASAASSGSISSIAVPAPVASRLQTPVPDGVRARSPVLKLHEDRPGMIIDAGLYNGGIEECLRGAFSEKRIAAVTEGNSATSALAAARTASRLLSASRNASRRDMRSSAARGGSAVPDTPLVSEMSLTTAFFPVNHGAPLPRLRVALPATSERSASPIPSQGRNPSPVPQSAVPMVSVTSAVTPVPIPSPTSKGEVFVARANTNIVYAPSRNAVARGHSLGGTPLINSQSFTGTRSSSPAVERKRPVYEYPPEVLAAAKAIPRSELSTKRIVHMLTPTTPKRVETTEKRTQALAQAMAPPQPGEPVKPPQQVFQEEFNKRFVAHGKLPPVLGELAEQNEASRPDNLVKHSLVLFRPEVELKEMRKCSQIIFGEEAYLQQSVTKDRANRAASVIQSAFKAHDLQKHSSFVSESLTSLTITLSPTTFGAPLREAPRLDAEALRKAGLGHCRELMQMSPRTSPWDRDMYTDDPVDDRMSEDSWAYDGPDVTRDRGELVFDYDKSYEAAVEVATGIGLQ
eukprot:TRINITY_DN7949_c0_g1_i1.p1 TRINITY_DN7949_c0_g1~~TRINITY_DN7949_c0_g1_i1.p1  ORF type:complete len:888 (-),score=104.06 TRINITY_DN7949_c0_g1_i1:24-2687(-)